MASLDFDQKFLGRVAKQTQNSNPLLSSSLYQILGLSVLLSRRLVRARKLRKLDTSRDTPSLGLYQHILWLSREGLSILELYVLPYAQDNQHGPECRVLSVKLRASFYHIFCLFHNQPPVTSTNMTSNDPRALAVPPLPYPEQTGTSQSRETDTTNLSPPSKRAGKQPMLREPIDSIVSETSFVTNPYSAGGPVGTPSPGPINAPPGLHPIPIPQPSSFILPPLNFVPLAGGYFTTATAYATSFLPGSHPLRLSVALEHSAFLWDCIHDHEGSRRIARRAIKDVYRAQEAMDDTEFEDAAELVGILGRMMKRKSFESTPQVGAAASPEPPMSAAPTSGGVQPVANQRSDKAPQGQGTQTRRRVAETSPITNLPTQAQSRGTARSRSNSSSKPRQPSSGSQENTPRSDTHHFTSGNQDTTPRARQQHRSAEGSANTTPRAPQGRSPATSSTVRGMHHRQGSGGSAKGTPMVGNSAPTTPSAAATFASDAVRMSPTLRRSPPLRPYPIQENRTKTVKPAVCLFYAHALEQLNVDSSRRNITSFSPHPPPNFVPTLVFYQPSINFARKQSFPLRRQNTRIRQLLTTMLITRGFSLTNFVIGSSALCFQIFVLYPWHEKLEEEFTELKKEHARLLEDTKQKHRDELMGIRQQLELLNTEKKRAGKFW
ncbi:14-3-3 protein [Massarina eburnea CBS 473.64]|uniref:14-3-3 protein n=1 Tax=Massarina eburnea CBS 473.64 TaxID=1395130 RepID=A0A6A6RWP3_9PLEO|nr:14-3-3 protein [Massarina eburnea CBS 473.64]